MGPIRLRGVVDLSNEEYRKALEELTAAGLVRLGRGRGGSLARQEANLVPEVVPEETRGLVERESDLYKPLVDWLLSSLESQDRFYWGARVTASPQGRRRSSGQWSRPDVTSVEVWRSEWLPQVNLAISSYEVKRFCDAERLESVYEAKAQGRWAHRSNLVVEAPPNAMGFRGNGAAGCCGLWSRWVTGGGVVPVSGEMGEAPGRRGIA